MILFLLQCRSPVLAHSCLDDERPACQLSGAAELRAANAAKSRGKTFYVVGRFFQGPRYLPASKVGLKARRGNRAWRELITSPRGVVRALAPTGFSNSELCAPRCAHHTRVLASLA